VRSFEPGEDWFYDYRTGECLQGPTLAAPESQLMPAARTTPRLHFDCSAAKMTAMSVAITVRGVPDEVRDELAARAARNGKSLQEYLRGMLVEAAARPSVGDVIARARARVDATGVRIDANTILAARDIDRR
jgi:antitoxin FitA